jgi:hypothetical protein
VQEPPAILLGVTRRRWGEPEPVSERGSTAAGRIPSLLTATQWGDRKPMSPVPRAVPRIVRTSHVSRRVSPIAAGDLDPGGEPRGAPRTCGFGPVLPLVRMIASGEGRADAGSSPWRRPARQDWQRPVSVTASRRVHRTRPAAWPGYSRGRSASNRWFTAARRATGLARVGPGSAAPHPESL